MDEESKHRAWAHQIGHADSFLSDGSGPWRALRSSNGDRAWKTDARVLVYDANDDGYQDLVVWKKTILARTHDDPDPGTYTDPEDSYWLMAFDTEKSTYLAPVKVKELRRPPRHLWDDHPRHSWIGVPASE